MICAAMMAPSRSGNTADLVCSQDNPFQRVDIASLPNAVRVTDHVFSGGQPAGEVGFRALRRLGVRTVISVDGAKPELAIARRLNLAYVHLPHGYDGIPRQRAVELAKAVSELPGPIYIHCHHGIHRSPAAAAVACVGAGLITPHEGQTLLRVAGTSQDYHGLHRTVADSKRLVDLAAVKVEFQESVSVPPLATSMVHMERTLDHLKQLERSNWRAPDSHPDLDPVHQAVLLREHFAELLRTDEIRTRSPAFVRMMQEIHRESESLEAGLRESARGAVVASNRLSNSLAEIANACVRCHRKYRD